MRGPWHLGVLLACLATATTAQTSAELARKAEIEAQSAQASQEAQQRKAQSIARLVADGVPVLDSLPPIADTATSQRRTVEDVVERAVALAILAVKGEPGNQDLTLALIDQFSANSFFTTKERIFIYDTTQDQAMRVQATWRNEAVHVLLWATGIYNELGRPDQITDVPRLADVLRDLGTEGLMAEARLRSQAELLDAADMIYRMNWALVQARLNGDPPPAGLDPGVVYERHYTLNWLIGYMGQSWDDITTDT